MTVKRIIKQSWYPNYLEHWNVSDIMERKPWRVDAMQLLDSTHTLYVGGSASFETVEDSFEYNLELARCAFFGRNLHSRMPLDPTHVRLNRTRV